MRTEDPRRLQEVVLRISTRDRPAGECKEIKNTNPSISSSYIGSITNRSKLKTNLKGTRPKLTADRSTLANVNIALETFKSQPQISVKSCTETHDFEPKHVENNKTQELIRNNITNSLIDDRKIENKTVASFGWKSRRRLGQGSQLSPVTAEKDRDKNSKVCER